ncbi:hypothetical protein HN51_060594 [Arachis hypogaea]|uniref:VQ domain-containing protein n=1 Tax=Arachis hypogaea TaxID=3818 RepID=A0A444XA72_ARAHY|nr:uncharacterized protein LOC107624410 [Arachis ipaensis]XP_025684264.1 uncharacterized protein LOC112785070 [Arachis hypogaea]QHO04783.1 Sigma factor binding protein 1 [Arachis hypogaea]RYQ86597.1 hypothetical protein Ahy_B10g106253 [Arachis hypogaea]
MDMLGVNHGNKKQSKSRGKKDNFKVTYISSPMKVKTSASKFRAVVQELTGQDSNVADVIFMEEAATNTNNYNVINNNDNNGVHLHQNEESYLFHDASTTTTNWLKPDYTEFLLDSSRTSSMIEPSSLQYDFLNFDMMY